MGIPDPAPDPRPTRSPPRWAAEAAGAVIALAIAALVVARLASSDRSWLLFYDGDSLVNTLMWRSLVTGQPQQWALSTVLFVPEFVVYAVLSLFGLGVKATLTLNAVVNLVALYAAIRFVAGTGERARRPVTFSLAAFALFGVLAMLETSASRDSLELASLMTTTTYYSATVIAALVTVGLVRRMLDRGAARPSRVALAVLVAVIALSTFSNPIVLAWAVIPVAAVLIVLGALRRAPLTVVRWATLGMLAGAVVGLLARIPVSSMISNSGAGYADPSRALESLRSLGALIVDRVHSVEGIFSLGLVAVLLALGVAATVAAARKGWLAGTFVAAASWGIPVLVVVGAVVLGTNAPRYLEPLFFAPVLAVTVLPGILPRKVRAPRAVLVVAGALPIVVVAVGALVAVPGLVTESARVDASIRCVDDWVTASGRVGAGQFWTIRAPKAYLADPSRLLQVDANLDRYAWLVNRADYTEEAVSFLVSDASGPPTLPMTVEPGPQPTTIDCGRYTITDFHTPRVRLRSIHS
ncbi:hypothetical protein [Leifsonia poae]|uniref:hypothetical protein n=1 Tax=Leifsonia poae TaxID=110933 RepID=UPI001CC08BF1|nr:hypothetical protein [Leifsonia poae]